MTTINPLFSLQRDSAKRRLLVYFYKHPKARHYLRELAALLEVDPANLCRDLKIMEIEGIFCSDISGNQKHFFLNQSYHFYNEMKSIISKMDNIQPRRSLRSGRSAYIIAGPNGAGKTTFAKTFLQQYMACKTFVNADLIASGISPLAPDQAALRAGKLLLEEIRRTAKRKVDFGFETTLSGRSYIHLFQKLKNQGFDLHLFFLWIPNIEISLKRIKERVRRGGHHIPEDVARRRFYRGVHNLFNLYQPFLRSWTIFDNSGVSPKLIAYEENSHRTVIDDEQFTQIMKIAGIR